MKRKIFASGLAFGLALCLLPLQAFAATTVRLAGNDRIDTSIKVLESRNWSTSAILARGDSYPDAVVAAPLAAALNAPVLLSNQASLRSDLIAALRNKGVKNVYLLGGYSALSATVEKSLHDLKITTVRYAGSDRYDTARMVGNEVVRLRGTNSVPVFVATGNDYPDALSAGAAAASLKGLVVLAPKGRGLDSAAQAFARAAQRVVAVGGPAVASTSFSRITATNIAGVDRYDTAKQVAATFFSKPATVLLATGRDFPDALAGGALAAGLSAPILLSESTYLSTVTSAYLRDNAATIKDVKIVGGVKAISDSTFNMANQAAQVPVSTAPINASFETSLDSRSATNVKGIDSAISGSATCGSATVIITNGNLYISGQYKDVTLTPLLCSNLKLTRSGVNISNMSTITYKVNKTVTTPVRSSELSISIASSTITRGGEAVVTVLARTGNIANVKLYIQRKALSNESQPYAQEIASPVLSTVGGTPAAIYRFKPAQAGQYVIWAVGGQDGTTVVGADRVDLEPVLVVAEPPTSTPS